MKVFLLRRCSQELFHCHLHLLTTDLPFTVKLDHIATLPIETIKVSTRAYILFLDHWGEFLACRLLLIDPIEQVNQAVSESYLWWLDPLGITRQLLVNSFDPREDFLGMDICIGLHIVETIGQAVGVTDHFVRADLIEIELVYEAGWDLVWGLDVLHWDFVVVEKVVEDVLVDGVWEVSPDFSLLPTQVE